MVIRVACILTAKGKANRICFLLHDCTLAAFDHGHSQSVGGYTCIRSLQILITRADRLATGKGNEVSKFPYRAPVPVRLHQNTCRSVPSAASGPVPVPRAVPSRAVRSIPFHSIPSRPVPSRPVPCPVQSCPVPFHPIPSLPIHFLSIPFHSIPFRPVPSHLVPLRPAQVVPISSKSVGCSSKPAFCRLGPYCPANHRPQKPFVDAAARRGESRLIPSSVHTKHPEYCR